MCDGLKNAITETELGQKIQNTKDGVFFTGQANTKYKIQIAQVVKLKYIPHMN